PHMFIFLMIPRQQLITLFPYTTLFRSDKLTLEDMKQLQMDAVNLRAREFVPLFIDTLQQEELSESAQLALALLNDWDFTDDAERSEEHTSELQSRENLVCRLLLEKKKQ